MSTGLFPNQTRCRTEPKDLRALQRACLDSTGRRRHHLRQTLSLPRLLPWSAPWSPFPFDVAFERFCSGTGISYAPFWDHLLGYWKASLERPEKVLFMRYEELMRDPSAELKRLAEFAGCPFSAEEEEKGVVDDIVELCRFENLSNLEVNKKGSTDVEGLDNGMLFRRGIVGDWVNHLTPHMAQRMDQVMESKFKGSGLEF